MTSTSLDLPRPDRRGFSHDSYDVAHNHRDAARTSPQRRTALALEILAAAGLRGCTGATLLAHGFSVDMLAGLVHDGLATAHRQTMKVGRRKVQFAHMMITDAGRSKADRLRACPAE
jgi:hypothetical protein